MFRRYVTHLLLQHTDVLVKHLLLRGLWHKDDVRASANWIDPFIMKLLSGDFVGPVDQPIRLKVN